MADVTKFLSLAGLQSYDAKIKAYIGSAVEGQLTFELVDALPATGVANVIYLVPNKGETQNVKDEYMWINNAWELIGTTSLDLSGYYKKTEVDTLLAGKVSNADFEDLEGRFATVSESVTDHENRVAALEGTVAAMYTNEQIDGLVNAVDAKADANAAAVATKAEAADLEALEGVVETKADKSVVEAMYTNAQIDEKIAAVQADVDAIVEISEDEINALFV